MKYNMTGRGFVYKRDVFRDDVDIIKSFEVFGWDYEAPRCIFINKKFYQTLIANKLEKDLRFEPIKLI